MKSQFATSVVTLIAATLLLLAYSHRSFADQVSVQVDSQTEELAITITGVDGGVAAELEGLFELAKISGNPDTQNHMKYVYGSLVALKKLYPPYDYQITIPVPTADVKTFAIVPDILGTTVVGQEVVIPKSMAATLYDLMVKAGFKPGVRDYTHGLNGKYMSCSGYPSPYAPPYAPPPKYDPFCYVIVDDK